MSLGQCVLPLLHPWLHMELDAGNVEVRGI